MGDNHGQIYDDGTVVDLLELPTGYCYDPGITGDRERKKAEMEMENREISDDLKRKVLYD